MKTGIMTRDLTHSACHTAAKSTLKTHIHVLPTTDPEEPKLWKLSSCKCRISPGKCQRMNETVVSTDSHIHLGPGCRNWADNSFVHPSGVFEAVSPPSSGQL